MVGIPHDFFREELAMSERKWHRWSDVKNAVMSAERQAEISAKVLQTTREMEIEGLRRMAGATDDDVVCDVPSCNASPDDWWPSLQRYVQSLGGEIEVVAVIGDHRLRLRSV